jgi:hypothetical protein
MAIWLKLLGAVDAPMPPRWLDARVDLSDEVGLTTRAAVEIADDLVAYAIPQRKIIGIAEVVSHPIKGQKKGEKRWPSRSRIRWKIAIVDYERPRSRRHLRAGTSAPLEVRFGGSPTSPCGGGSSDRARAALNAVFDPGQGDRANPV